MQPLAFDQTAYNQRRQSEQFVQAIVDRMRELCWPYQFTTMVVMYDSFDLDYNRLGMGVQVKYWPELDYIHRFDRDDLLDRPWECVDSFAQGWAQVFRALYILPEENIELGEN